MKLAEISAVMGDLFPGQQNQFRWQLNDWIASRLAELAQTKDEMFFRKVANPILPSNCKPESVAWLNRHLDEVETMNAVLYKRLRIALENDENCVKQKRLLLKEFN